MQDINTRTDLAVDKKREPFKSDDDQNENPVRTYRQPMRIMTLRLVCPADVNLQRIDDWLQSVLKVECSPGVFPLPNQAHEAAVAGMAWRCLLLTRTFLQAGNVPVFDAGSVLRIHPHKEDRSLWNVEVTVASIEHIPAACYALTIDAAVKIVHWVLKRSLTPQHRNELYNILEKQLLDPLKKMEIPGKSRLPILRVAHRMNIPFSHLGAGIYQLGWGRRAKRMDRSSTQMDSALGSRLAQNKFLSANLLRMAGLPAPVQGTATTQEEAVRVAQQIGWPVVIKPVDLDRGEGVTIGIKDEGSATRAFSAAINLSRDKLVVIERHVPGICHRICITAGQLLYAIKRFPKSVMGNGVKKVAELIQEANAYEQNLPPWLRSKPFPDDAEAVEALTAAGLTLDSVPAVGELAPLREIESTEWGGIGDRYPVNEVTGQLHPANLDIALRAAALFNLDVAGIDIISADISKPWYENGAVINEVNFSPLLGGSIISRKYIPEFLNRYIQEDGRIPIYAIVGGKVAMDIARTRQKELVNSGTSCFLTSHALTLTASLDEMPFPFISLHRRCRAVLMNRQVEAVVLVIQNDELLHTGTPVDRIDQIITVDKNLTDWQRKNEKMSENRLNHLLAMLGEIKIN
jgi:cyanophycin synthetase